jgi:hypothetical protein
MVAKHKIRCDRSKPRSAQFACIPSACSSCMAGSKRERTRSQECALHRTAISFAAYLLTAPPGPARPCGHLLTMSINASDLAVVLGKADTAGRQSEDDAHRPRRGSGGSVYLRKAYATRETPWRGRGRPNGRRRGTDRVPCGRQPRPGRCSM